MRRWPLALRSPPGCTRAVIQAKEEINGDKETRRVGTSAMLHKHSLPTLKIEAPTEERPRAGLLVVCPGGLNAQAKARCREGRVQNAGTNACNLGTRGLNAGRRRGLWRFCRYAAPASRGLLVLQECRCDDEVSSSIPVRPTIRNKRFWLISFVLSSMYGPCVHEVMNSGTWASSHAGTGLRTKV